MSLRLKFALAASLVVLVLTLLLTYVAVQEQSEVMRGELLERGKMLCRDAVRNLRFDLKVGDVKRIQQNAQLLSGEKDVAYIVVLDEKADVLAVGGEDVTSRKNGEVWRSLIAFWHSVPDYPDREESVENFKELPVEDGKVFHHWQVAVVAEKSVGGQQDESDPLGFDLPTEERIAKLGTFHLGLSTARTEQEIARMVKRNLTVGALVLVGTILVLAFLIQMLIRPLRALREGAVKIAQGNLAHRVPVKRKDEVAELAQAFNEMAAQLENSQEELIEANLDLEEANRQLQQWSRNLEEQVKKRTAELEKANVDLERAIAEKEDFLRAVSHDLNAPLRNIGGISDLIMRRYRDRLDDTGRDRLARIQKNVERLSGLIGDLLELSRIKTQRLKFSWVEVVEILEEVRGLLEYQLQQKEIEWKVTDSMPRLYCEKARLKQIFQNLVDNAIKYIGERDSPRIELWCEEEPEAYRFYVRDNGPGIRPEDREMIFHVFRRSKSKQTANIPGKGVGLSAVKQIVESYGGEIRVESVLGKGSTFIFALSKQACTETSANGEEKHDQDSGRGRR